MLQRLDLSLCSACLGYFFLKQIGQMIGLRMFLFELATNPTTIMLGNGNRR
jgi:hypothetical protein